MRWLVVLCLIGVLCFFQIPGQADTPTAFRDVPVSDPAYSQLQALEPYLFTGYPDETFNGRRALVRVEFAVAIQRMCQEPERLLAAERRAGKSWLRSGPATRADSPWKPARVVAADNPLRKLLPLVREFSPELNLFGMDVDRAEEGIDACLRRGLVPLLREGKQPVRYFDHDAVKQMGALSSPRERAEAAVRLLREEIAHPSPDTQYITGREEHPDYLQFIIVTAADSRPEAGTVLDAWLRTDGSRLHDCLTLLLGRMGVAHAREELRVCAADAEMPQPLRVVAVLALRKATSPADIRLLIRLTQTDGAAFRDFEHRAGCMASGPDGWHYPVRRAARDVLARLTPSDASAAALAQRTVHHAVVFEKLAPDAP